MKWLISSILLFLLSQQVLGAQFSCEAEEMKADYHTFIQHAPDFFTKAVPIPEADKATFFKGFVEPEEDLGTYIGITGGDNNRIIRLNKHKPLPNGQHQSIEYEVPGPYDPVPSPDGRILSVAASMRLYDIREFLVEGHKPEPIIDNLIGGVYQSIAWLRGDVLKDALREKHNNRQISDNQRLYRMVVDNTNIIFIDFLVTYEVDCDVATAVNEGRHCIQIEVLKPEGSSEDGSWNHCGDVSLKTLYISKKGTYISGYTTTDNGGVSKILDISKNDGACPEVLNFGHPLGKVDFNDNEDKVTFHVDYITDNAGGYFSMVDDLRTKDVFVMDLEKQGDTKLIGKNLRRFSTTLTRGKGCYYPSFFNDQVTKNGVLKERILCMYDEGNTFDDSDGYSFRTYTVSGIETETHHFLPNLDAPQEGLSEEERLRLHNAAVIGLVWGQACNPVDHDEYTAVQAAGLFLNIKHEDCELIAELWGEPNTSDQATLDFRTNLARDRRFEDDPRFNSPEYIFNMISKETLLRSCQVSQRYQAQLRESKGNFETQVYGSPGSGEFVELDGYELARRKCTGCHHYGVPLHAVLAGDLAAGISSFTNVFEFESWEHPIPLMYIDASLERMGYDPLSGQTQLKQDILSYLGEEPATSRQMPPVERVTLQVQDGYNEREILGRYLFELREERVREIQGTFQ